MSHRSPSGPELALPQLLSIVAIETNNVQSILSITTARSNHNPVANDDRTGTASASQLGLPGNVLLCGPVGGNPLICGDPRAIGSSETQPIGTRQQRQSQQAAGKSADGFEVDFHVSSVFRCERRMRVGVREQFCFAVLRLRLPAENSWTVLFSFNP